MQGDFGCERQAGGCARTHACRRGECASSLAFLKNRNMFLMLPMLAHSVCGVTAITIYGVRERNI